jgi:uncharacterized protein (DUF302 family)
MSTKEISFTGVQVVLRTRKAFDGVCGSLEGMLGRTNVAALTKSSTREQIVAAAKEATGPSGFTIFQVIEHGLLLSVLGLRTAKARLYVIGNALVAAEMTKVALVAGLRVPLRLLVYEEEDETVLTYEKPSSVLTLAGVVETARKLDQGLARLTAAAAA